MYIVAILTYVFHLLSNYLLIDWVYKVLQTPLLGLSQSFFAVILMIFLNKLFWFFGLHGGNVLAPIMEGLFGVAMLANLDAFQKVNRFLIYGQVGLLGRLSGLED